jgi:hypothetical protein
VELPAVGSMGVDYLKPAYFGQAFAPQLVTIERGRKLHLVGMQHFYPIVLA